jgi:serine/threonine protein kinase
MGEAVFARPDLLAGRYLLGDVIGRGGMGVVRRAWDTHLERYVAVKLLRNVAMDPESRVRFSAEVKTLAGLNHPGLITLFDAATQGDEPYLVMELVVGGPLNERCHGVAMEIDEVASIGARLADALAYVHQRQLVHRDVKPSNVLLADDGRVKLADFGIARLVDGVPRHTATGITMGTAGYLSPEQVRDEPVGVASDIYSLGLVLIEALTGAPVFAGPPSVVMAARLTTSPRLDESFPAPLRALLEAMTDLRPQARPSADQVAADLRGLLSRLPPPPRTATAATVRAVAPTSILAGASASTGVFNSPRTEPLPIVPAGFEPEPAEPGPPPQTGPPQPGPPRTGPRKAGGWPIGRVLLAVAAVTVVVAALLLGPLKNRPADPGAGVGRSANSPKPAPAATAASNPVKDANKQVHDALTKAQNDLKKKAQDEAKQAGNNVKKAAQRAAEKAAKKAADKLKKELAAAGKKAAEYTGVLP